MAASNKETINGWALPGLRPPAAEKALPQRTGDRKVPRSALLLQDHACDTELTLADLISEYRIEAIIAEELLHDFLSPVSPMRDGIQRHRYLLGFTNK